jgi:hypothetical protein
MGLSPHLSLVLVPFSRIAALLRRYPPGRGLEPVLRPLVSISNETAHREALARDIGLLGGSRPHPSQRSRVCGSSPLTLITWTGW